MQENSWRQIKGEIKGGQLGKKVGEKMGEKVEKKTGEKVGKSLGEIHKLNLCPTKLFQNFGCPYLGQKTAGEAIFASPVRPRHT